MKVFIKGIEGNMGRRYKAIMEKFYGGRVFVMGADINTANPKDLITFDRFIVTTPTKCHADDLLELSEYQKPILCEKPITTSFQALQGLFEKLGDKKQLITMVNQYKYLKRPKRIDHPKGLTKLDYYKTGSDGLAWDCINIIGEAKGDIILNNESPIWTCIINGYALNIKNMDLAYISMLHDFLTNPKTNWKYIKESHRKVEKWLTS